MLLRGHSVYWSRFHWLDSSGVNPSKACDITVAGVAWEMDSVTNLPPGMILPVTILPPGRNLSVIHLPPPWQVYPLSKKKPLFFTYTNTEYFWAHLDHNRVIFRQILFMKGFERVSTCNTWYFIYIYMYDCYMLLLIPAVMPMYRILNVRRMVVQSE